MQQQQQRPLSRQAGRARSSGSRSAAASERATSVESVLSQALSSVLSRASSLTATAPATSAAGVGSPSAHLSAGATFEDDDLQLEREPQSSLAVRMRRQGSTTSTASARSAASLGGGAARFRTRQQQQQQQQDAPPQARSPRQRLLSREEAEEARRDREARSIALERAYVHDVYEQISLHISDARYRAWPRVKQFLQDLEPGAIVCDVGCGSGKYLNVNPLVFNIGSDRCLALAKIARKKDHEILHCDNLCLPFRDASLDAVLSVAVIHHIATVERRVRALREIARALRVGGRVIISVWAMEQRHRKFESQDVLIPWHRPAAAAATTANPCSAGDHPTGAIGVSCCCFPPSPQAALHHPSSSASSTGAQFPHQFVPQRQTSSSSSLGGGFVVRSGGGGGLSAGTTCTTTTTTSDDDVTHYHAYTQTSDSAASRDESRSRVVCGSGRSHYHPRHRGRLGHPRGGGGRSGAGLVGGRSVDPLALELGFPHHHGQSSSDLSSPNETCYSFVRRAFQKLSTTTSRRQIGGYGMEGLFMEEELPPMLLQQHQQQLQEVEQDQENQQQQPQQQQDEEQERRRSRGDSQSSSGSSNISRLAWYTLSSLGQFSSSFVLGTEDERREAQLQQQQGESTTEETSQAVKRRRRRPIPESMELSMEPEEEATGDNEESKKEEDDEEEAALELAQIMTAEEAEALLGRFDSGESTGDSSLGDLPIELRHLESDFVEEEEAILEDEVMREAEARQQQQQQQQSSASSIASNLIHSFFGGSIPPSSMSLEDPEEVFQPKKEVAKRPPRLGQVGRASTYDEGTRRERRPQPALTATLSVEREEEPLAESGLSSTAMSGSLRSIGTSTDFPHVQQSAVKNAGSVSSISSGRSVQSDSGMAQGKPVSKQQLLMQQQQHKPRSWDSEPRLDGSSRISAAPAPPPPSARMLGARSRAASHHHLLPSTSSSATPGEKEKSKAMLSVESKLMKAIKEVNESDLSENSTPLCSPAPQQMAAAAAVSTSDATASSKTVEQAKRPQLVKQKQSFHFPDEEDKEEEPSLPKDDKAGADLSGHEDEVEASLDVRLSESVSSSPPPPPAEVKEKVSATPPAEEEEDVEHREKPPPPKKGESPLPASISTGSTKRASSLTSASLLSSASSSLHKQSSLNEELLSLERVKANVEVRRGSMMRKQQSLPSSEAKMGAMAATLKERLQQLRDGWRRRRSRGGDKDASLKEEEEEEENGEGGDQRRKASITPSSATSSSTAALPSIAESSSSPTTRMPSSAPPSSAMGFGFGASEQGIFAGGFVRILQRTWSGRSASDADPTEAASSNSSPSSSASSASTSFTLKKGVSIQPLDVRHSGLDSATRRSLFQRRRVSSPISPKQMEALGKEGSAGATMSPGALRRCCMDYPGNGGDGADAPGQRERKLSRGEAGGGGGGGGCGSDSSSKDGSIQSDTSLDSEDSCVSVIFIPRPEGRFGDGSGEAIAAGMTGSTAAADILVKKQRSTSNSSESSDSVTSGRGSPMSPNSGGGNSGNRMGSPIRMAGLMASQSSNGVTRQSGQLVEAGANGKFAVARAIREESGDTTTFFVERPLEKIEERGTESEAEEEEDHRRIQQQQQQQQQQKEETKESGKKASSSAAGPKSFEMEDLPDENPIRCHPAFRAKKPSRPFKLSSQSSASSRRSRFDYPIVRHHPLFAKQRPMSLDSSGGSGASSNFSSLLLGENVRVIRRSSAVTSASLPEQEAPPKSSSGNAKMRSFEIFNPETDDLDSDNESTTTQSDDDDDRTLSKSSEGSVESVVSVVKEATEPSTLPPPTLIITEVEDESPMSDEESFIPIGAMEIVEEKEKQRAAKEEEKQKEEETPEIANSELRRRAEERAKLLKFFLEENKSILGSIGSTKRRSRAPVGTASSVESGNESEFERFTARMSEDRGELQQQQRDNAQSETAIPTASLPSSTTASAAEVATKPQQQLQQQQRTKSPDSHSSSESPAKAASPPVFNAPLPPFALPPAALAVPSPARPPRRRLDKARSVSPGRRAAAAAAVVRQSSVPSRFDEVYIRPTTEMEIRTRKTLMESSSTGDTRKVTLAHLDVSGDAASTTRGSRESLASIASTDGSLSKSKSPSPSRSDASHVSSSNTSSSDGRNKAVSTGAIPKKPLSRQASLQKEESSHTGAGGRMRRVSGSGTPPRRRRQLPPLPTGVSGGSKPPSLEDLALTESLIPSRQETLEESDEQQQFSVSKLVELDPRFDRGGGGSSSAAGAGGVAASNVATAAPTASSDVESISSFPYRRLERGKRTAGREDSLDSTSTSAKSSVQYSDTSSLLSHRFSTVSISSNVSSDVSFGGVSSAGGSSCYLASMSSADFDEGPPSIAATTQQQQKTALTSSVSLSEADENEYLGQQHKQVAKTPQERLRMKTLFRRGRETSSSSAKEALRQQQQQQQQQHLELLQHHAHHQPRSRIGTETSADSVEHVTCIDRSSFEDSEAFAAATDEQMQQQQPAMAAQNAGVGQGGPAPTRQASVSTTSDSASDSGGSLTHHRFYHVFREGELDYLINQYVENLHIISSYYDHANWCVIAEKVNVWTI